ncbi:GvpL/GvpF family gas vesicle protein [Herbidospora sp. NBRC 101105]|uniref:GvpL/GvpF family gas vesicle protein n=1 Tax=Herbidospora sp. NBRC 101105 TaxID=3032195 RepID=UPI00249FD8C2|nr:GvpL/GvpF family gas vesicle protein [Herbidospora sp. NBRC 101105]GLX95023.1 gas vesicle protein [Herbidospora sp. NBRC 101105]
MDQSATYIYGVVPQDIEVDAEATGVGDPPAPITSIRHGKIAALVSDVSTGRPLGTPKDLYAHEQLLNATAAEVPVLPIRFGAVLASREAVVEEFLAPYHDEFAAALTELEGRSQFVIKGRFVEETVLGEILAENPEAAQLREEISTLPEDAARDHRIRLGEIINQSIEAKRDADTAAMWDQVEPVTVMQTVRPPSHELDAVHMAVLVENTRQDDLDRAVEDLARKWADQVTLSLFGPMAPYDFIVSQEQDGE